MTLTPKEQKRIDKEERALLYPTRGSGLKSGYRSIFIIVAFGLMVALGLMSDKPTGTAKQETATSRAPVDSVKVSHLRGEILLMCLQDVVVRIDSETLRPKIYVGPGFYRLTFRGKQRAIQTVNDFFVESGGNSGGGLDMDVHDAMSGRKIYEWKLYELEPK